jgi:hypothetical protein
MKSLVYWLKEWQWSLDWWYSCAVWSILWSLIIDSASFHYTGVRLTGRQLPACFLSPYFKSVRCLLFLNLHIRSIILFMCEYATEEMLIISTLSCSPSVVLPSGLIRSLTPDCFLVLIVDKVMHFLVKALNLAHMYIIPKLIWCQAWIFLRRSWRSFPNMAAMCTGVEWCPAMKCARTGSVFNIHKRFTRRSRWHNENLCKIYNCIRTVGL